VKELFPAIALIVAGCVPQAARPIDRRFFAPDKLHRILVMEFDGNRDLTQESTGVFIAMLSTQSKVEIVRSEPELDDGGEITQKFPWYSLLGLPFLPPPPKVDGRTITIWQVARSIAEQTAQEMSRLLLLSPMVDRRKTRLEKARREARRRSAELIILGSITSTGENLGRNCVSTVIIHDAATGAEVAVFRGYYNQFWTFSSRPVARNAVALTAKDTLALLR
jgi:hypothetical protein